MSAERSPLSAVYTGAAELRREHISLIAAISSLSTRSSLLMTTASASAICFTDSYCFFTCSLMWLASMTVTVPS